MENIDTQRYIVLCCGGRDYANTALVDTALTQVFGRYPNACLLQGGARGADALCAHWARAHGKPCMEIKAPWDTHGKAAGTLRNQWMLDYGRPSLAVAFPGGNGTADMVRRAEAAGVPVWMVVSHAA